jgi:hypothetical protein
VIAGAIGGAVGAGALAISSPAVVAALAGVLFLGAAIVMARLPGVVPLRSDVPDSVSYDELHRPRIVATAWAFTMVRAAVGFFVFGLAFALRRESEPAWMYAAAVALYGVGAFLGNMAAPVLRRRYGEDHLTAGSLVVLSIVAAFAALGQSRPLVLLAAGVLGGAASVARQGFDAMVQTHAPSATHGRTFARFETRFQLAWVLGAIAATAIRIPIRISLAIVAAALIPAAVLYLRALREGHAAHADEPFNPVEVARARLDHAREWQRRGAARLAVTELAGVVDLARATGRRLDPVSVDRLDRLRSEALSTWPLDDREVTWALARATDLVEAMEHDGVAPRVALAPSVRTDSSRVSDDPKGRSELDKRSPIRLQRSGGAREPHSVSSEEDVIDHSSARSSRVSTAFDQSASVR